MKTKVGDKIYEYESKVLETVKINKIIRDELNKICKDQNIIKGKLIEEFYRAIITKYQSGDLKITKGFLTINVFNKRLKKKSKSI